jgi:hypothetical protein
MLNWRELDGTTVYAHDDESRQQYLVTVQYGAHEPTGVRLVRVPESVPLHEPLAEVRAALATEIVLPLGRGPGRPGGEPELAGLVHYARALADRYARGRDLDYPGWQHAAVSAGRS